MFRLCSSIYLDFTSFLVGKLDGEADSSIDTLDRPEIIESSSWFASTGGLVWCFDSCGDESKSFIVFSPDWYFRSSFVLEAKRVLGFDELL